MNKYGKKRNVKAFLMTFVEMPGGDRENVSSIVYGRYVDQVWGHFNLLTLHASLDHKCLIC